LKFEPVATSHLVSQSFIDHLRQARGDDQASCETRAKRRKVAVAPGKSLSAADIPVPGPSNKKHASTGKGKCAGTGTGTTNANVDDADISKPSSASKSDSDSCKTYSTCSSESEASAPESDLTDVKPNDTVSVHERPGTSNQAKLEINEGEYVIVTYEGHLYPGEVKRLRKDGAEVRCMVRSGKNWKWPSTADQIWYKMCEITAVIAAPKQISSRGIYSVPELHD
jgi:hypothetical protein